MLFAIIMYFLCGLGAGAALDITYPKHHTAFKIFGAVAWPTVLVGMLLLYLEKKTEEN